MLLQALPFLPKGIAVVNVALIFLAVGGNPENAYNSARSLAGFSAIESISGNQKTEMISIIAAL